MKKIKFSILLLVMAFIPASTILSSCSGKKDQAAKVEEKPVVKLATAELRNVEQIGTYTATVEAEAINNISSSMPGRIKQILVDEGMRVSAGQRLVVLDDVNTTSYHIQVDNAKANLRNVETNYNRALELYRIGGGTKQNVDQMETQLINAKNALASAQRALRNAAENTVLTAPISGVVTARNYDPGDMTGQLPILTIARVQPVKVVINVSETELSKVHRGMPAEITFDTFQGETFTGKVSMIAPTVDAQSRTFGVEITLPNPESRVLPGMFGRVTLNLGHAERCVVPDKAVVKQPGSGNQYVYVYSGGKVSYNKVTLGRRIGSDYEVIEGVPAGSQVVVYGQAKLSNGKEVQVAK